jgi:predicted acyl esterase
MIKIHSTWFPLIDRNPQKFIDIPKAREKDYSVAKQTISSLGVQATFIELPVVKN